jgi:putative ABC transport system permease protein
MLNSLVNDLRYAARQLARQPGFTAVAALTLALGIGANSTIFSIVNAVLLRPLPYKEPDRLVMMLETNPELSRDHDRPSPGNFLDWRERNDVFDGVAAWYQTSKTLRDEHDSEQVEVAKVAGDFFDVLGVDAIAGETFSPVESPGACYNVANQYTGGERIAVISERLWRSRFGADPNVINQTLLLDGLTWQIKGVMPASFAIPAKEVDLWVQWDIPGSYTAKRFPEGPPRDFRFLHVIARIKRDVTINQAEAHMSSVASQLAEAHPKANKGWGVRLAPLKDEMVGSTRKAILVLFGAVVFVLLIACANIASLLLARASARQREMAVRAALGASRARLVRQMLTESLCLSAAGGIAGLALAFWGKEIVMLLRPGSLPRIDEIAVDGRVLIFTCAVVIVTAVLCGIAPALKASKTELVRSLKEGGSKSATAGRGQRRFRNLLVAAEISIALVLLVGAGLLTRSFAKILAVDAGFDPKNLLVMRIYLDNDRYRTGAQSSRYFGELTERLRSLAAVKSVAASTALPMSDVGVDFDRPFWREGEADPGGAAQKASIRMVTPDYFETLGIPVPSGRAFTVDDRVETPAVIVVNQTMARQTWPGQDAVGKRLLIDYNRGKYLYQVVGVAGDVKHYGLKSGPKPEVFIPHAQNPYLAMSVVVRTETSPEQMAGALRREVREMDSAQPVHSITTADEFIARSVGPDRFSMLALGLLAAVALILAAVGIYGVMSYLVSQRTHEIGVRMALGASSGSVLKMAMGETFKIIVTGLAAGLVAAYGLSQVISSLLYNVSATDLATFASVTLTLSGVALLAGYFPARRAAQVDPMVALRCE